MPKTPPNDPVWNAYRALFDGAAVPRAGRGNVSEPVADTFVRPSTFRVRWNPRAWSGNLAVELLDHKGTRIWHADRVPASDGKISAEAARDALSKAQDGKYSRNGILVITERSGTEKRISFRILSSDDSASVDRDLAAVDTACKNAEWLRHAARAGILLKRGLIGEATDEAAHAAELAPAGAPVRATAVKLLEAAGESARAKQLAEPAR